MKGAEMKKPEIVSLAFSGSSQRESRFRKGSVHRVRISTGARPIHSTWDNAGTSSLWLKNT